MSGETNFIYSISIGFIAIIALVMLAVRELAITKESSFSQNVSKFLNIQIFILITLFAFLFALIIIEILQNK